jgi:uncharacterized cupredoxin-like copper-binding protein
MSITTTDDGKATIDQLPSAPGSSMEERIGRIEDEVREQGKTVRNAQRGWSIFAVMALLIAGANLLAVATKLDKKSSTTSASSSASPAANAASPAPAVGHTVNASLKEFSINPSVSQAAAGKVAFHVRNSGTQTHEFVVLRTDKPAASLPIRGGRADETGNVGETRDLSPGASKTVTLNLKAGHYALVCNLPGHYLAGQHSDFTVK